jgi:hypothetical protein
MRGRIVHWTRTGIGSFTLDAYRNFSSEVQVFRFGKRDVTSPRRVRIEVWKLMRKPSHGGAT